ncbi:pseudouridine synthase [Chitinophaga eiseniae]|nr:pseudouridine synthase [Chitinophaga eiseniae]
MKKKQPAKKGFGPSRDNKMGKSDKPAGNRNRFSVDGERPGRASAKDSGHTEGKPSFRSSRFEGGKTGDEKPAFRKRTFDNNERPAHKPGFSAGGRKPGFGAGDDKPKRSFGERGEDKPRRNFGERGDTKPKRNFGERSEDKPKRNFGERGEDKPKRSFGERGEDKRSGDFKRDDKPAFGKRTGGEDKPLRKRTYGVTRKNDDSAFHFHGDNKKGGKSADRETPSGFNRKKFFDKTNERFADKQDRKKRIKVKDTNHTAAAKDGGESKQSIFGPGEMPLNKFVAHCGLCSRRKAVDLIKEGKVTVNGKVVTEPATKVTSSDHVTMQDKKITPTKNLVYILLNKPKGYITTTDDPEGRKTVMDLIQDAAENERVYPVGRLDRNTSGLLLLTNDGELAQRLAHPKHNIKKIYQVELDKPLTKGDFDKIIDGVTLEDGVAVVDALGYVDPKDKKQVGIEIHSGKNRIVRRIFEHLEYTVEKLDRVMYAGLTKKTLNRGQWRFLTEKEVILLKHFKK